jgi:hypothetical protein
MWICLIQIQFNLETSNRHKNIEIYGLTANFSAILQNAAILKTCENNFYILKDMFLVSLWHEVFFICQLNVAKKAFLR